MTHAHTFNSRGVSPCIVTHLQALYMNICFTFDTYYCQSMDDVRSYFRPGYGVVLLGKQSALYAQWRKGNRFSFLHLERDNSTAF